MYTCVRVIYEMYVCVHNPVVHVVCTICHPLLFLSLQARRLARTNCSDSQTKDVLTNSLKGPVDSYTRIADVILAAKEQFALPLIQKTACDGTT